MIVNAKMGVCWDATVANNVFEIFVDTQTCHGNHNNDYGKPLTFKW